MEFKNMTLRARISRTGFVCCLMLVWNSAQAQVSTLASNLPEASLPQLAALLKAAVSQSPVLLSGNLDVAYMQAVAIGDKAQQLPQINSNASFGYQDSATGSGPHKGNVGFFYNLGVNQALYHWGAIQAQAEIGKIRVEVASHRNAEAYRILAISVRNQYLGLIQKKRAVALSASVLKRAESGVAAMEQRFQAGSISLSELNDPKLRLEETRLANDRLVEEYAFQRAVLARTCGVPAVNDTDVAEEVAKLPFKSTELAASLDVLKSFDVENTEQGRLFDAQLRQSNLDYFIASKRLYPMLGLGLNVGQSDNTNVNNGLVSHTTVRQESAFLQVSWNLFDGFQSRSAKRAALAQKRIAEFNRKNFATATEDQLKSLQRQLILAARTTELAEIRLSIAKSSVVKFQEDAALGHGSPEAIEDALQVANGVELTTTTARIEFYNKLVEFVSLLGGDPAMLNLNGRTFSDGNP